MTVQLAHTGNNITSEILSINWSVSCVNFLHLNIARRTCFETPKAKVICLSLELFRFF